MKHDPDYQQRRRRATIALSLAAGLALHAVGWRAGANVMTQRVDKWIADQRAAGMDVTHGNIKVGGYPFLWRARIDEPSIGDDRVWRWRADQLSVAYALWAPQSVTLSPNGGQRVDASGAHPISINARRTRAVISAGSHGAWSLRLDAGAASISPSNGATIAIGRGRIDISQPSSDSTRIDFIIALERGFADVNDERIEAPLLSAEGAVTAVHAVASADTWRLSGGVVRLDRAETVIEDSVGRFDGAVSLDETGSPAGLINVTLERPAGFARALGKSGLVTAEQAQLAEGALVMAALAQGGVINGPLQLERGEAKFAGVRLGGLPIVQSPSEH